MLSSALVDIEDLRDEVQNESFNADEYLESYIQRNMGNLGLSPKKNLFDLSAPRNKAGSPSTQEVSANGTSFDPDRLLQSFNDLFENLVYIDNQYSAKYDAALKTLEKKEKEAAEAIRKKLGKTDEDMELVLHLEGDLNDLARKVYFLCDQIHAVSEPQERLKETRKLLTHFMELNNPDITDYTYPELTRSRKNMQDFVDASSILLRLYRIAKDMGTTEDKIYDKARNRIFDLYNQLQADLVRLFAAAHSERPINITTMQEAAQLLQSFPVGYNQCVLEFVSRAAVMNQGAMRDIFGSILSMCGATQKIVREVFPAPDAVMDKFIEHMINDKLKTFINEKLDPKNAEGQEGYLRQLYELHKKTKGLEQALIENFKNFRLEKLTRNVFESHLSTYVQNETSFLRNRCNGMLQQYYDALLTEWGLVRPGQIQVLQEKRDFFNVGIMIGKTIPSVIGDYLKDHPNTKLENKLINESIALNLLHELRQSSLRALALASDDQLGDCLLALGRCIVDYVMLIHLDYGLEIGLQSLPPVDPKNEPDLGFLSLVNLSTDLYNLTVQKLNDCLQALTRYGQQNQKFRDALKEAKGRLERKSNSGLEQCLNSSMNWLHNLLAAQPKTQYAESRHNYTTTNTARKVAQYFSKLVHQIESTIDGANRNKIFLEIGLRFHREVFDRLVDLPYTSDGVMVLICDVNEYRECARMMKVDVVVTMFDQLLSLCNLLLAKPNNLPQMCENIFSVLEQKEPIAAFLRLRSDFRVAGEIVRDYL